MKKRIMSILLTAVMVLGTFSTCVFALEETPVIDQTEGTGTVQEESTATEEPAAENATEEPAAAEEPAAEEPAAVEEPAAEKAAAPAATGSVSDVVATAGALSATVTWTAEEGLTYKVIAIVNGTANASADPTEEGKYVLQNLTKGDKVSFRVQAYDADGVLVAETESNTVTAEKIAAPTGVKAFWAYNSIALEWYPVDGAVKYWIYKDGVHWKNVYPGATAYDVIDHEGKLSTVIWDINDDKYHSFYVRAMSEDGTLSDPSATQKAKRVTQMYIQVRLQCDRNLTSHDGKGKTHNFKKGTWVTAFGFGGGKYRFYYNGNLYWLSYLNTDKAKAITAKTDGYTWNWSKKEAEYFINTAGVSSKTKYYFWVSPYVQHVYVFKGSKGKWKLYDDWECNTGAAATPSPTGFDKAIYKKVYRRNGHGPWSAFQSWTSFHDIRFTSEPLGSPISHACVRCPNAKADWIYNSVPLQTSVGVY